MRLNAQKIFRDWWPSVSTVLTSVTWRPPLVLPMLINFVNNVIIITFRQVFVLLEKAISKILLLVIIEAPQLKEFSAKLEIIMWSTKELVNGVSESILAESIISVCNASKKGCFWVRNQRVVNWV